MCYCTATIELRNDITQTSSTKEWIGTDDSGHEHVLEVLCKVKVALHSPTIHPSGLETLHLFAVSCVCVYACMCVCVCVCVCVVGGGACVTYQGCRTAVGGGLAGEGGGGGGRGDSGLPRESYENWMQNPAFWALFAFC